MTEAKSYIIAFDVEDPRADAQRINRFITGSDAIDAWWNYLPLVYVVQSRATAKALSDDLQRIADGAPFFVAEIDTTNMNGWLPRMAWDWFADRDPKHGGAPSKLGPVVGAER